MTTLRIAHLATLLDAVRTGSTLIDSTMHGEAHWRSVGRCGVELQCVDDADLDGGVLFLFALLHDARRETEHRDPEHGPRAAELAVRLHDAGLFSLHEDAARLLDEACRLHDTGVVSTEPTIGACYDADRLNLRRCGIEPDPRLLSRPVARTPDMIDRCAAFDGQHFAWGELLVQLAPGCAR